jgi:hypothetical protein
MVPVTSDAAKFRWGVGKIIFPTFFLERKPMSRARIAGLPMYDLPSLRGATDAFWRAIAGRLRADGVAGVPEGLSRELALLELWTHPDLLLAQTCGLPLVTLLEGRIRFVATPAYAVEGCEAGDYRSWLVVRDDSPWRGIAGLEGTVAAVNAPHSQSGANALASLTAPFARGRPFFTDLLITGAHTASLRAVRSSDAACAAVDCVTWALLAASDPKALRGLRVLAASEPSAGAALRHGHHDRPHHRRTARGSASGGGRGSSRPAIAHRRHGGA